MYKPKTKPKYWDPELHLKNKLYFVVNESHDVKTVKVLTYGEVDRSDYSRLAHAEGKTKFGATFKESFYVNTDGYNPIDQNVFTEELEAWRYAKMECSKVIESYEERLNDKPSDRKLLDSLAKSKEVLGNIDLCIKGL